MRIAILLAAAASVVALASSASSELASLIERVDADRMALGRTYPHEYSPARRARFEQYHRQVLGELQKIQFEKLSAAGQVDYVLLRDSMQRSLDAAKLESRRWDEMQTLVPFAGTLFEMEQNGRRLGAVDPAKTASLLNSTAKDLKALTELVRKGSVTASKVAGNRAASVTETLRRAMKGWFEGYNGYDPMFSWWLEQPFKTLDGALETHAKALREKVAGVSPDDRFAIVGDPVGRDALIDQLNAERIPYTPEELLEIGQREWKWCEQEMIRASRELKFGDDWLKALEHVKTLYVEPGKQTQLVRDLAEEAIQYVEQRGLVTVPPVAKETWRMTMLSPEAQMRNPFFLGGELIQVSYPTSGMPHDSKMMSMRGNNPHFSRSTVFHELIPGHHLQRFMNQRHNQYRRIFSTPFWIEGWAFYWEMLLWDAGFPRGPEDRIGMLYWRMHRAARIIFSISFHLGKMTPEECIDLLVKKCGQEPANASAEVRRSFDGSYPPVYQAAYMLGALQFRQLHKDLVQSGKMPVREFHDRILEENQMPVEMVRAILTRQKLTPAFPSAWRFYDLSH